jgi:hypothetical protein
LKEHETNETIRLKEAESEIEVTGKKALADHEVDIDFKKKMNTLVAITRYQHLQFDAFDEVRGRLITLVQEAHRIENSNMDVYLKGEIMGKMQQAIAAYQEVFDDYRRRIMEGGDGEAIRQIDSITKLAGSGEFGDSSAPFKIHSPQSGDRD